MGIRFLCPTCGHKLNVKSFLAGKRGVCPQCGIGLNIPLESQVNRDGTPLTGGGAEQSIEAAADEKPTVDVPTAVPTAVPTGGSPLPAAGQPVVPVRPASPTPLGSPLTNPSGSASPLAGAANSPVAVPIRPAAPIHTQAANVATPAPVEAQPPAHSDPIDESPDSVWYVRPPSGGQYGPARGEILRKWISEGRVSADSLVWREGWDDWLNAADVFPNLLGGGPPSVGPPGIVPNAYEYAPSSPNRPAAAAYRPRRKSSAALAVTAVVVLGLMSVALLITLFVVIQK